MLNSQEINDIESNLALLGMIVNNPKERLQESNDYARKIIPISERISGQPHCKTCPDAVRDAFVIVNKTYKEWKMSQEQTTPDTNAPTGGTKTKRGSRKV